MSLQLIVNENAYRFTGPPPCQPKDYVAVGDIIYLVKAIEPLYYEFRNYNTAGLEIGFLSQVYPVADLIPSAKYLYYHTGFGVNGDLRVQAKYQAGNPRNTVGTKSSQFLDRFQARYLSPFTFKFVIVSGDTLEVDIRTTIPNIKAAIWFYGWKLTVQGKREVPVDKKLIQLEDVREI